MKWRKVKKRFNKDKHKYKGLNIVVKTEGDISLGCNKVMSITNVKIYPGGGKKVSYELSAEPLPDDSTSLIPDEWKDADVAKEQGAFSSGFDISFDMKIENPTKELKNLMDKL